MKILVLDIETSPNKVYVWGLFNQNVALNQIVEAGSTLCFAAKWLGQKRITFSSIKKDGREAMLRLVYNLLNEADVVIHYNGTKFDIPTLNQEFMSMGWNPPSPFQEIDILRTVRKRFRLTSNKLDYVLRFLHIPCKVQHKGMALWHECMLGDTEAWKTMKEYNIGDVEKLEEVYRRLQGWVVNHPNHGLYVADEVPVCPNCGSRHVQSRGYRYTATQVYNRFQCQDCGGWSQGRVTVLGKEKRAVVLKGV